LVKAFNDPELLDLKLDVYYPKTDLFKGRPLVMLIHGGAFTSEVRSRLVKWRWLLRWQNAVIWWHQSITD
jgi:acetyl esterase/lipase